MNVSEKTTDGNRVLLFTIIALCSHHLRSEMLFFSQIKINSNNKTVSGAFCRKIFFLSSLFLNETSTKIESSTKGELAI